jgi:hypothetical protein
MMEGDMEDRGRLPGFIKLAGDGLIISEMKGSKGEST